MTADAFYDRLALALEWPAWLLLAGAAPLRRIASELRGPAPRLACSTHTPGERCLACGERPFSYPPELAARAADAAAIYGGLRFTPEERAIDLALRPGWIVNILADRCDSLRVHGVVFGPGITVQAGEECAA